MKYEVKLVPIAKTLTTPIGVVEPLCQSCENKSCSNPIETTKVSVFGINKQLRLYVSNNKPQVVVQCEGYIAKDKKET